MPRIGTVYQQLLIVIGFEHQRSASLQFVRYQPGAYAEISGYADFPLAAFDQKTDRITCIVGCGKRINKHIMEGKRVAGFEFNNLRFPDGGIARPAGRIADQNRYLEFPCKCAGATYMVGMLMADQDGIQFMTLDTYGGKPA